MNNGKCGNCRSCNVRENCSEWQAQSRATTYTSMIPLPPQNDSIPSAAPRFGSRQRSGFDRASRKGGGELRGINKHFNSISASSVCPPLKSPACAASASAFVWRYSPTDHSTQRTMNAVLYSLHDHFHFLLHIRKSKRIQRTQHLFLANRLHIVLLRLNH